MNMQIIYIFMHKYAIGKYAEICRNMQKYAEICKKYVRPQINSFLRKYARKMQDICTYMQNMQQRLYMQYMQVYASPTLLMAARARLASQLGIAALTRGLGLAGSSLS